MAQPGSQTRKKNRGITTPPMIPRSSQKVNPKPNQDNRLQVAPQRGRSPWPLFDVNFHQDTNGETATLEWKLT